MNSYEISANQVRFGTEFSGDVNWSNVDWHLKEVKQITSNTVKTTFSILVDLYDQIYIDQTLSMEFIFAITGEKSRELLFDENRMLQLTLIDTVVSIKERETFKTV